MDKHIKAEIKEILSKTELTRYDAKFLLIHLYQNSFYVLGNSINISALWLKEMLIAVKPFTQDAQQRMLQDAQRIIQPRKTSGNNKTKNKP